MKLDTFIEPAKEFVKKSGGRVDAKEFHKVLGQPLAERMISMGLLVKQTVLRKDIRGKVRPMEVTYYALKTWKQQ